MSAHALPMSKERHYQLVQVGVDLLDDNGYPFTPEHVRVREISTGRRVWAVVSGRAVKKNGLVGKAHRSRRFQLKGDPRGVVKSQLEVPEWLLLLLGEAGEPYTAAAAS